MFEQQFVSAPVGLVDGSNQGGDTVVELFFCSGGLNPYGFGKARGNIDFRHGPGIADHHLAEQFLEPAAVLRAGRIPLGHEPLAKSLGRLELARLEQGDQVVQLHEIVFHRRGGQQEQEPFFERVDQLPVEGIAVFKMMGLIDDHHVIFPAGHGIDVALGFCLIDGGQNKRQVP